MNRIVLNIYSLYKVFIMNIQDFIKLMRFSWFLLKNNMFRDGNPKYILKIVQEFLKIEHPNYRKSIVRNRTPHDSYLLLSSLINSYFETSSSVTLDQIIEVLKEEFIKREG